MLERIRRLGDVDGLGSRIAHSTPEQFFGALALARDELPVWVGELYLELHRGTYTTGGAIKYANRMCERLMKEIELWSVMTELHTEQGS